MRKALHHPFTDRNWGAKTFSHVYVCVICALTSMCAGVHVLYVHVSVYKPGTNTERLPRFLAAFFIEVGFLSWAELIALQYSFSGKPVCSGLPGLHLSGTEIMGGPAHPSGIHTGSGDLASYPHTCASSSTLKFWVTMDGNTQHIAPCVVPPHLSWQWLTRHDANMILFHLLMAH